MFEQAGDCLDRLKLCPAVPAPGLDDGTLGVLPCLVRIEVSAGEITSVEPVRGDRINPPGLAASQRCRVWWKRSIFPCVIG